MPSRRQRGHGRTPMHAVLALWQFLHACILGPSGWAVASPSTATTLLWLWRPVACRLWRPAASRPVALPYLAASPLPPPPRSARAGSGSPALMKLPKTEPREMPPPD
eukprot:scaffold16469_cov36-Phaeocystis_antarctica.AAC.1